MMVSSPKLWSTVNEFIDEITGLGSLSVNKKVRSN